MEFTPVQADRLMLRVPAVSDIPALIALAGAREGR
jgi:hypothetical protein